MARAYRLQAENTFYHITNRGDNRKRIYDSEYDYKKFLEYVLKAKKRFEFYLYAYALIPNHYHLLIETLHANLSKIMHYINSSYTTYYNVKRRKAGHLFQGRYRSIVVDSDSYFSELTRYIHLNPVKAKMVKFPEEYKWSSYNGYIEEKRDEYIDMDQINKILGMGNKEYGQFVMAGKEKKEDLFKDVYGGFLLGSKTFIKTKLRECKEQIESRDMAHKKELRRYVSAEDIINVIKNESGKSFEELFEKRAREMKHKKIAIYLLREFGGLDNRGVGEILGMNFSAVSKAALDIEKKIAKDKSLKREVDTLISNFEA